MSSLGTPATRHEAGVTGETREPTVSTETGRGWEERYRTEDESRVSCQRGVGRGRYDEDEPVSTEIGRGSGPVTGTRGDG